MEVTGTSFCDDEAHYTRSYGIWIMLMSIEKCWYEKNSDVA